MVNKETYSTDDIISLIEFESKDDAEIMRDIISLFMSDASKAIAKEKIVKIPYIGTVQKNIFRSRFNKAKTEFKELRGTLEKEEYKAEILRIRRNIKEQVKKEKENDVELRKLRRSYRKEWEFLCEKINQEYADNYIYFKYGNCYSIVPFDEDVEYALQELWRMGK